LHGIIKIIRDDVADYCSNRLGDLKRACKRILAKRNGTTTTRTTLFFEESMKTIFDVQAKSVKVKEAKRDATANSAKYALAVKAFWMTYNK
jgi:hypothetical protein